jgi:hypothetical protein
MNHSEHSTWEPFRGCYLLLEERDIYAGYCGPQILTCMANDTEPEELSARKLPREFERTFWLSGRFSEEPYQKEFV